MSGLASLLAGHHESGVYTWHSGLEPGDVRWAVEHAGAGFGHVDGWMHQTKSEFLEAVGEALGFPDWYGANLDAFAECLDDLDAGPVVLLWDGWSTMARSEPGTFAIVLEILSDRAAAAIAPFSVLLRGAGPEIAVPALDG